MPNKFRVNKKDLDEKYHDHSIRAQKSRLPLIFLPEQIPRNEPLHRPGD